jgi:hypothetical protein
MRGRTRRRFEGNLKKKTRGENERREPCKRRQSTNRNICPSRRDRRTSVGNKENNSREMTKERQTERGGKYRLCQPGLEPFLAHNQSKNWKQCGWKRNRQDTGRTRGINREELRREPDHQSSSRIRSTDLDSSWNCCEGALRAGIARTCSNFRLVETLPTEVARHRAVGGEGAGKTVKTRGPE